MDVILPPVSAPVRLPQNPWLFSRFSPGAAYPHCHPPTTVDRTSPVVALLTLTETLLRLPTVRARSPMLLPTVRARSWLTRSSGWPPV